MLRPLASYSSRPHTLCDVVWGHADAVFSWRNQRRTGELPPDERATAGRWGGRVQPRLLYVDQRGLPDPEQCEERERLTAIYLDAVFRNNEAATAMAALNADSWRGNAWRHELKAIRAACEAALEALDRHRAEHGC